MLSPPRSTATSSLVLRKRISASSTMACPKRSPTFLPPRLPSPWCFSLNSAAVAMAVFLRRFGPRLSELRRYERRNGQPAAYGLPAGRKSVKNFLAGDRRLFLVSSVRRRDARCVSECRRVPAPPVQPLLLAYSRRKGRQISQG